MEMNRLVSCGMNDKGRGWKRVYQVERAEFSRESIGEEAGISSKNA